MVPVPPTTPVPLFRIAAVPSGSQSANHASADAQVEGFIQRLAANKYKMAIIETPTHFVYWAQLPVLAGHLLEWHTSGPVQVDVRDSSSVV